MTIDKQALRQIAESVDREEWDVLDNGDADYQVIVSGSLERGATYRSYQPVTNEISNKKIAAFIAAFNPKVALALLDDLDKKQQYIKLRDQENEDIALTVGKLRVELEAAKKRIAELERTEIREDGNQFLVVRHPGKLPVIKHCVGELEDFLRQLIERDSLVTIDIITHRYYGVGGQWVQDAGEYLQMMQGAGIGVKQQEDSVDSDVGSRNQPGMVVAVHIGAGDFVKVKGQVFEVEETDFDDHDVTLWFVGGNALKCAAGCPVEVVSAPVAAGIRVKES
ncbi:ead/Ea22-like family protein [Salmonella enterica]|nr:ead/Ea22-like family protein [Salmonella enterica]